MSADNLSSLLDALGDTSVYVIEEKTHRLLYCNKRCRETGRGKAVPGALCHEIWPEVCRNCPLKGLNDNSSSHIVCYDPLLKSTVDVTASRILWDGHIQAAVITAAPHCMNFEEKQGLRQIERMYAQSLVTVFDECIIANLTQDYYVNCQKDALWTDIPEQGDFGMENQKYSRKVMHPDDLDTFNSYFSRESMLRLFGEGRRLITRRLRRMMEDGSYHMVEFTAARIEKISEKECWCVLVFRDIQEEYLQEQQRNLEVTQLATAVESAYQMLIAVNLTRNTYHMLEYERFPIKKPGDAGTFEELIQSEVSTVRPDFRKAFLDRFSRDSLVNSFRKGERIISMEVPHLGEDGTCYWNFTQVVQVESPYSDDLIEITLSRNIDEARRQQREALEKEHRAKLLLEDALQKAEKASQAKSDFLSRMSHDIRTPMNAIVGMTELARLHLEDTSRTKDYLDKITSSSSHLLSLINEVLDVSKIESGTVQLEEKEFDLRSLMEEASEMIRLSLENKCQQFSINIDENAHFMVTGDMRRLKQVLVNILENASKYTEPGGKISFSLKELKKQELQIGTYCFVIEDSGIGMKPEYLEHIFEPFSRADEIRTSKISGTGLGMTIVRNLVRLMGGDLQIESRYGQGTRFSITLCLTKCAAALPSPAANAAINDEGSFTELMVLLAEDNELNRQIAVEMLEFLGARVETAVNGREAVNAVLSHPQFYYDMVLMDIQMPELGGYDAAREIRHSGLKRVEELPIIAMTADAFAEDVRQARLAGMSGHLAKPISISQLKKTLSECLSWKYQNRPEERKNKK